MPLDRSAFPYGYRVIDPRDPYEVGAGPFYVPEGSATDFHVLLRAGPAHCNGSGVVHGGLLMTMADVTVCAAAVQDVPGERAVTISLNADFVAAGLLNDLLEARAEVVRRTGSLVFARGEINTERETILTCSAVIKRMRRT